MWNLSESKASCRARGRLFAEIDCVVAKNNEAVEAAEGLAEPLLRITQHSGFHVVCLNHWVLQTA